MLKSLYPLINWDIVQIVGFDLDGTLYDEMDFIVQVYKPISEIMAKLCNSPAERIFIWMLQRWLEMGSSYNRIFSDVLSNHGIRGDAAETIIAECLSVFRGYKPELHLPFRVSAILDRIKERFGCFLISDGSANLQMKKFKALGLERWISHDNFGITGFHGHDFAKPSTKILDKISLLRTCSLPKSVVYFGDRDIDSQFATAAGFQFVRVNGLIPTTTCKK